MGDHRLSHLVSKITTWFTLYFTCFKKRPTMRIANSNDDLPPPPNNLMQPDDPDVEDQDDFPPPNQRMNDAREEDDEDDGEEPGEKRCLQACLKSLLGMIFIATVVLGYGYIMANAMITLADPPDNPPLKFAQCIQPDLTRRQFALGKFMHPQEVPKQRLSKCLHQDWNGYVPSSRYKDPGGFGKFNSALPKYSQSAHIRFLAFTDKKFRNSLDELQKPDVDFAAIPSRKTTVFIHTRRREPTIDATTPGPKLDPGTSASPRTVV